MKSKHQILLMVVLLAGILFSCENGEKIRLQAELDAMNEELQSTLQAVNMLTDVGIMLDSIDANRQVLRTNMVEGTSYTDFNTRMKELNTYVKEVRFKIQELEKLLETAKGTASAYALTIKKLKADLEKNKQELVAFQELADSVRSKNEVLVKSVQMKDEQLNKQTEILSIRELELTKFEKRVEELLIQSRLDEAEAYFAHAQAVEETAKRTHLAPRKKKKTEQEAIELYKLALLFGKEEAQEKINLLQAKL
jgi:hypothetical protein